jgi:hypothetical protein
MGDGDFDSDTRAIYRIARYAIVLATMPHDEFEVRAASDIRIRFQPMRQEVVAVASETVSVSITIKAPTDAIFAVLVDPAKHVAIDGTGWVIESLDRQPLTSSARFRSNTEA